MNFLPGCAAVLSVLYAQPTLSDLLNPPAPKDVVLAPLLSAYDVTSNRFFSVGNMIGTIGVGRVCTASLVAGSDEPDPQKPALILTAGHCAGGLTGDNEVVMDHPMGEGWFFTPSYFHDNKDQHVNIPIVSVVYSTMKSTDFGVLQLGETYGQMLARGFKPLRMRALKGAVPDIDIAHVARGLFRDHYLRYSECSSRQSAAVYETIHDRSLQKDLPWFWPGARPSSCIGLYGGSSGAPVFARGEWNIVGVHSTSLREEGCGIGKPCEIEGGQPVGKLGTSYFASIEPLVEAFKPDGSFDASSLDPGTGIVIHRQGNDDVPSGPKVAGERQPVRWGMMIDESFESIRYKIGPADETRCDQPKGYGEAESVLQQSLMDRATPMAAGVYVLCAVGKRTGSSQWQPWSQATIKLLRVESSPEPGNPADSSPPAE